MKTSWLYRNQPIIEVHVRHGKVVKWYYLIRTNDGTTKRRYRVTGYDTRLQAIEAMRASLELDVLTGRLLTNV